MISIIGCGWLGMPLAKSLIAKGYTVKGSTTKVEKISSLKNAGIVPFCIQLSTLQQTPDLQDFLDSETLIINVPPGRNSPSALAYVKNMMQLFDEVKKSNVKHILFVSSSSVYEEQNDIATENSDISLSESAKRLFLAEEIFKKSDKVKTTVLRMSGLFGPERHPGRFFAGKKNIANGLSPINMIHLDDCIGIIETIIAQKCWNKTFNAAAPSHPTKKDFYTKASLLYGGEAPEFVEEKISYKIISTDKLQQCLNYKFKHPDLISALDEL